MTGNAPRKICTDRIVRFEIKASIFACSEFPEEEVNPIVFNGISTRTKQQCFFSMKGNGYVRTIHFEQMTDDEFVF